MGKLLRAVAEEFVRQFVGNGDVIERGLDKILTVIP